MTFSIYQKSKSFQLKIALFLLSLCSFFLLSQHNDVFAYDHLESGEWVVSPNFTDAQALFDGMVLFTDQFGYKCILNSNRSEEGVYFMDPFYSEIIIPDNKTSFNLASNMFVARKMGDIHIAYYDKYGVEVLNDEYLDGSLFSGGIAWVQKKINGKKVWGAINTNGVSTTKFIYNACTPLSGGNALVNLVDAHVWVIVDGYGNIISEFELLAGSRALIGSEKNGIQVFTIKDKEGQELYGASSSTTKKDIVPIGKYTLIDNTQDDVIIVENNSLYGLINQNGNEFVPCIYKTIAVTDGFAILTTENNKVGIATLKEMLFEAIYDSVAVESVTVSSKQYYVVTTHDNTSGVTNVYFFDKNYEYVRNNPFPTFVRDPETGYQVQGKFDSKKGKMLYGMIDRFGTEIIPYEYEELSFFVNGYALTKKDTKYGIIKIDGNIALECIAKQIIPWKDSGFINYNHCIAQDLTGKWGLLEVDPINTITLSINKSQKLVDSYVSTDTVIWQSMDTSVATVDTKGKVLAVGPGSTSIIIFNLTTGINKVYMVDVIVPAKKVTVTPNKFILKIDPNGGQSINSTARITYSMTSLSNVYSVDTSKVAITSNKPLIAGITYDGKIQALSFGRATVTVQEVYGGKKANIAVYVYELPSGITIKGKNQVGLGKAITLTADIPNKKKVHKDDRLVLWESSDDKILRVDSRGRVTGISAGTAYVRVTTLNGITAEIQIDVAGGGQISKFPNSGTKNIYTSDYSLREDIARSLIQAMEIRTANLSTANTMWIDIEGYQTFEVTLDPYITAIDPAFQTFMNSQMYSGNSLTDANAEKFMDTIIQALNAALREVNPVFAQVQWSLLSDGRVAIYMANGKKIQIPGCSNNAEDKTVGHGFLHLFFSSLNGNGNASSDDNVYNE